MESLVHVSSDTLLLILIGLLSYMFQRQIRSYDLKHAKHFEHATDMELHETERERALVQREREALTRELLTHIDQDERKFASFEDKLDTVSTDIKEILKAVGGPKHGV